MTGQRPAAELLVPRLGWDESHGFAPAQALVDEALDVGVGGFLISGGDLSAVRSLVRDLRRRSRVPLLLGVDAERGAGQALAGATGLPPIAALVGMRDPDAAVRAARLTAREARTVGVNWVLAPTCEVAHHAGLDASARADTADDPAADPAAVGAVVAAWIQACQGEGVLACARRFPGAHERAEWAGSPVPVVRADAATLRLRDLAPFRAAIGAGVATVLASPAAYPALDGSEEPADLSAAILRTLLRKSLRFDGLVASTALDRAGPGHGGDAVALAIRAVAAGGDLLIGARQLGVLADGLAAAADDGRLPPEAIEQSRRRRRKWAQWTTPPIDRVRPAATDLAWGAALSDRALRVLRGPESATRAPVEVAVANGTSPSAAVAPLLDALRAVGVAAREVLRPTPGARGSLVVALFGDPRAEEGATAWSPEALARLSALQAEARDAGRPVVVAAFAPPQVAHGLPGDAPVLAAWSADAAMQHAVARRLAGLRHAG